MHTSPPTPTPHARAQVEAVVEMGATLSAKDKQGRGPLHFAAAAGREPVVRFLLSRGAEVDPDAPGACACCCPC